MSASEAKHLKSLEKGDRKLKQIIAKQTLEYRDTQDSSWGKALSPAQKRQAKSLALKRLFVFIDAFFNT